MRGATCTTRRCCVFTPFLLTRPLRGATVLKLLNSDSISISTHTPLAGRDISPVSTSIKFENFYSHAPCGARRIYCSYCPPFLNFYSHAPCGARRAQLRETTDYYTISTHTPLAGRDHYSNLLLHQAEYFYSHAPCGARL